MTHYELKQLATRVCEHGRNVCCACPTKTPSPTVQAYLDRAKRRLKEGIIYNSEHVPTKTVWGKEVPDPNGNRYRWVEHPGSGLRFVGKAHDIRGSGDGNIPYFDRALIDHTGWFTDVFHDEKVAGEVYQLPTHDGKSMYIPAVEDPCNDGALLDFHSITDDLHDAIRWADSMAERYADDAREYSAKDTAEQRIESINEELKTDRQSIKALTAELKQTKGINPKGEVCKALRAHIAGIRGSMRELKAEREKIQGDFWEASPNV